MTAKLNHSVVRRLRNFPLSPSPENSLIGVYEAISNSIHAASEMPDPTKVRIDIEVVRGNDGALNGFRIVDNAVGLTDANFDSFCNVDSDLKLTRGGKGVGRLTWLKTFDSVKIASRYDQNGTFRLRSFQFVASDSEPFVGYKNGTTTESSHYTQVELTGMKSVYLDVAPKKRDTLLKSIVRHFVKDLIASIGPEIRLVDDTTTDLKQFFKDNVKSQSEEPFEVAVGGENRKFILKHFLASNYLKDQDTNENTLYFLAHGRVVDRRAVGGLIGLKRLSGGRTYFGLVESEYFDGLVTQERTMFVLNSETIDRITRSASELATTFLSAETQPIRARQVQMLKILKREYPRYIGTIKDEEAFAEKRLPLAAKDQETLFRTVSLEWYRNKRRVDREIRVSLKSASTPQQVHDAVSKIMTAVDAETKAALADYMTERKVVIDIFDDMLAKIKGGKHHLEAELHNIVCPMGANSDTIEFDRHNLWLLDERLPHYTYFNSDIPISSQTKSSSSGLEPDITFYDVSLAFEQRKEPVPIIIVEFKRPGRDDYTSAKNPIDQSLDYVERIRSGEAAVDSEGKHVSWIKEDSLFYCYIVADLTKSLKATAKKHDLSATPDGRGLWKFHDGLRTMIEIMPYDKVVEANRMRHEAFFQKLGIN